MKREIKAAIEKASVEELDEMQVLIQSTREIRHIEARNSALEAAKEAASKHGFNLDDLIKGKKGKKKTVAPKYRNPENAGETWTGRGRRPKWVEEALSKGKSLKSLEIG